MMDQVYGGGGGIFMWSIKFMEEVCERGEGGGGVLVDDRRWLGVTSGFPYIEMKSLLLWSIVL